MQPPAPPKTRSPRNRSSGGLRATQLKQAMTQVVTAERIRCQVLPPSLSSQAPAAAISDHYVSAFLALMHVSGASIEPCTRYALKL